jgi:hypothetical protein
MPSHRKGGPLSAQEPAIQTPRRFTLSRGAAERPVQFDGIVIAEAEADGGNGLVLRAAVYEAKGGQYVSEFSRHGKDAASTGKAMVFEGLDDALAWFRPGKLTAALRKQLGRWEVELLDESASTGEDDMTLKTELLALLDGPTETLSVEYKSWLNLGEPRDRAVLAKAAIAMANSGGGIIVLGMREQDDSPLMSTARPRNVTRYSPDDVNQAVNRFADPEIHCDLRFATHPETKVEQAYVRVPGNSIPVMSRREHTGVIGARKCYIRKPGPRSEEPMNSEEWRDLLDRCVRARRDEMMNAIRLAVHGDAGHAPQPAAGEALRAFTSKAYERWRHLTQELPADDGARFPLGHYAFGFEILGGTGLSSLAELRNAMREASAVKHTGWGPFALAHRDVYEPQIKEGAIEAWFGANVQRMLGRDPAHTDYWRADAGGRLVLLRGYDEDGGHFGRTPGTVFDITLPVWRLGEAVLYVDRLARAFGEEDDDLSFLVQARYLGLQGRTLTHLEGRRMLLDTYKCAENEVTLDPRQITRAQVRENLVEVVHRMLAPLYERFGFFALPVTLVAEELARLQSGRF